MNNGSLNSQPWINPTKERVHNFYPGPGALPEFAVTSAQEALWNYGESGLGLTEYSHSCKDVAAIIKTAKDRVKRLLNVPENYDILFLQGGGATQFHMLPLNLASKNQTIDIIHTGYWTGRAIEEAELHCDVNVVASSESSGFRELPKPESYNFSKKPAYVHYVCNNTIYGTQFSSEPIIPEGIPLVCDASSDILFKPIDIKKYGVVFASSHKNLGPAGIGLVIIRKDLLNRAPDNMHRILKYSTHANAGSLYNSAPMFTIYFIERVLKWLEDLGGLSKMEEINIEKAKLIYDFLDSSSLFTSLVKKQSERSIMNVCFSAPTKEIEEQFAKEADIAGYRGLRGHALVGNLRASIYNAVSIDSCSKLVDFMKNFEKRA